MFQGRRRWGEDIVGDQQNSTLTEPYVLSPDLTWVSLLQLVASSVLNNPIVGLLTLLGGKGCMCPSSKETSKAAWCTQDTTAGIFGTIVAFCPRQLRIGQPICLRPGTLFFFLNKSCFWIYLLVLCCCFNDLIVTFGFISF